jgi:ATP-dependent DNA ligase
MLRAVEKLPDGPDWVYEIKLRRISVSNRQWLRPALVAQIEFAEWTPDNHLRHSQFVGLRDDKDPMHVRQE